MNHYAATDKLGIKSERELAYRRGYADGLQHRARQFHVLTWLYGLLFLLFLTLVVLRYV